MSDSEFATTCICGTRVPNKFTFSGPHLKQYCAVCDRYIKFSPTSAVPHFTESKNKIWVITQDLALIEKEKAKMAVFHPMLGRVQKNVYYHNLYVNIVKLYT